MAGANAIKANSTNLRADGPETRGSRRSLAMSPNRTYGQHRRIGSPISSDSISWLTVSASASCNPSTVAKVLGQPSSLARLCRRPIVLIIRIANCGHTPFPSRRRANFLRAIRPLLRLLREHAASFAACLGQTSSRL